MFKRFYALLMLSLLCVGISTSPVFAVELGDNVSGGDDSPIVDTDSNNNSNSNTNNSSGTTGGYKRKQTQNNTTRPNSVNQAVEGVLNPNQRPGNPNTGGGSALNTSESASAISKHIVGFNSVTDEQMNTAQDLASPWVAIIGKCISFLIFITTALLGLVTVMDIMYITLPYTRNLLYGVNKNTGQPRQLVSTEAIMAVDGQQMQGGMGGGMGMSRPGGMGMGMGMGMSRPGGMGMGMSRPGGMGMGGMQGGMGPRGGQQQPGAGNNALFSYFKSRVVTLVLFAICLVLLLSSIFFDFGTLLAGWIFNIISYISTMIPKT